MQRCMEMYLWVRFCFFIIIECLFVDGSLMSNELLPLIDLVAIVPHANLAAHIFICC